MDKSNHLSIPMVVRTLNIEKDQLYSCENDEVILGSEVSYLSIISVIVYLANCTRPDIFFAVNLLERFSSYPTKRYWNEIKHIFCYLRGTTDLRFLYSKDINQSIIGYDDVVYLSDPHKPYSQTRYVFTSGDTAISWRSQKQILVTISSNHVEIIALHEASRECV